MIEMIAFAAVVVVVVTVVVVRLVVVRLVVVRLVVVRVVVVVVRVVEDVAAIAFVAAWRDEEDVVCRAVEVLLEVDVEREVVCVVADEAADVEASDEDVREADSVSADVICEVVVLRVVEAVVAGVSIGAALCVTSVSGGAAVVSGSVCV